MTDKNGVDVLISFDSTGSMYPVLRQVRRTVQDAAKKLFKDIPDLHLGIIAHGDYCDAGRPYVTKQFDFTNNVGDICHFVSNVEPTGGGDAPECYELVLHEARTDFSWRSGRSKVLVMIGDDVPHGPSYRMNTKNIDWRNELGLLLEAGINVYGVHAMPGCRMHSKPFYTEIADKTGGFYLTLDQFAAITDLIMGVCYKQDSDESLMIFEQYLEERRELPRYVRNSFKRMRGEEVPEEPVSAVSRSFSSRSYGSREGAIVEYGGDLIPVPVGRFQVFPVESKIAIRRFVEDLGISFKSGRGFYELTKAVKVQQHKEILLVDKETGDVFNGTETRKILGLQPQVVRGTGGVTERLNRSHLQDRYKVFIQSTSYNRELLAGTDFMYEVEDWDKVAT